jgi:hypothetical protein
MGWPLDVRSAGARFYIQANYKATIAGDMLVAHLKGDAPQRPGQFCKRWWTKLEKYGSTKDRPRCSRLRRKPAALAKEIAEKIVGKLNPAGQSVYHTSLKGFLHAHPTIKQQVEHLGVPRRTLQRAIRAADPDLVKRKVGIRKLLNNHQMEKRRKAAAQLRRIARKKLRSTVFVDEASFEIKREGGLSVYAKTGVQLPPITNAHVMNKAASWVHCLGGVMHGVGSVGIFKLTGTTDHARLYMVRSTCPTDDLMRTFLDRPYVGDHVMLLICQEQSASVRVEPALATHKTSPMSDSHSSKSSICILSI